ncbi:hypothetical protein WA026_015946 [Henosepilachna vigintioctopunctata]|uniref:Uncharacterized protein n=1 Tax=Henosepilachna vigintioctopunctata TaxID=420089 RepID=A0AAW1U352_9CUCU
MPLYHVRFVHGYSQVEALLRVYRKVVSCTDVADKEPRTRQGQMMLAFAGQAGFSVLSKPVTTSPNNSAYLNARWKAYCATLGEAYTIDMAKSIQDSIMAVHTKVASRIQIRQISFS